MTFKSFFGQFTILSLNLVNFLVPRFHVSHLTHETFKLCLQNTLNMSKLLGYISGCYIQTPPHFQVFVRRSSTFPQLIRGFIGFLVRHSSFLLKFCSYVQQPHFAEVNRVQSFGVLYHVVNKNHQKVLHIHHLYHFLSP